MAKGVRVKCPQCGEVMNLEGMNPCSKCGTPLDENQFKSEGMLQLYRMGSPIGVAMGYGLYLDGVPMGHLANKESVMIPLKFGQHKLHCTCGATRRCKDLEFSVTPENPMIYAKARLKAGMWTNTIIVEQASQSDMP